MTGFTKNSEIIIPGWMVVNDSKLGKGLGSSNLLLLAPLLLLFVVRLAETCPSIVKDAFKQYLIILTSSPFSLLDTNSTRSIIRRELLALDEVDMVDSVRLAVMKDEKRSLEIGEAADLYDMYPRRLPSCLVKLLTFKLVAFEFKTNVLSSSYASFLSVVELNFSKLLADSANKSISL